MNKKSSGLVYSDTKVHIDQFELYCISVMHEISVGLHPAVLRHKYLAEKLNTWKNLDTLDHTQKCRTRDQTMMGKR